MTMRVETAAKKYRKSLEYYLDRVAEIMNIADGHNVTVNFSIGKNTENVYAVTALQLTATL